MERNKQLDIDIKHITSPVCVMHPNRRKERIVSSPPPLMQLLYHAGKQRGERERGIFSSLHSQIQLPWSRLLGTSYIAVHGRKSMVALSKYQKRPAASPILAKASTKLNTRLKDVWRDSPIPNLITHHHIRQKYDLISRVSTSIERKHTRKMTGNCRGRKNSNEEK